MFITKFKVIKNTILHIPEVGVGDKIVNTYKEMLVGKKIKYLPFDHMEIPVEVGETIEVEYGPREKLLIPETCFSMPGSNGDQRCWRNMTCSTMTIKVDDKQYEGEMIAYEGAYPCISFDMHAFMPLNDEALSVGGFQLDPSFIPKNTTKEIFIPEEQTEIQTIVKSFKKKK